MTKLKGVKTLNRAITKIFSAMTGATEVHFTLSTDFCYLTDKQEICFSVTVSEKADNYFTDWIKETYNYEIKDSLDLFLVSLFHEFGHYCADSELDDNEYLYCYDAKTAITKELDTAISEAKERQLYYDYFNLTIEKKATDTAMIFLRLLDEQDKAYFKRRIAEAIQDFYRKNNVKLS